MNYQKLTFEDIMQTKILYYDKEVESACFDICATLKIDTMPDYNSKSYYELVDMTFVEKHIEDNLKLNVTDRIFESQHIEKFRNNKHNVLYVFAGNVLKGIVHFADYNANTVLKRIQDDVLSFEMNLREFLVLNGKTNEVIQEFYKYKNENEQRENKKEHFKRRLNFFKSKENEIKCLGQFQMCDLSDLMDYCNSSYSNKLFKFENSSKSDKRSDNEIIRSFRNMVMHGKNPIEKNTESSIFSIASLLHFQESLKILEHYNSKLEELIHNNADYQRSVQLENQSKLKIIHEHHPGALKYFIGN